MNKMLLLLLFLVPSMIFAQTTLQPGQVVIMNTNGDDSDSFSFMSLVDIAAGTQIHFTDIGWNRAPGEFKATEQAGSTGDVCTYIAPAGGLSAGVVVSQNNTGSNSNFAAYSGYSNNFINSFAISYGDQVLVFQGSKASPTFIWGHSYMNRTDDGYIHDWTMDGSGNASGTDDGNSDLPTGLTNGVNAIVVPHTVDIDYDNGWYNGPTSAASADDWRARVVNTSNWSFNDVTGFTTHAGQIYTVLSSNATITFTDGSSFTPSITPGTINQVLGRFQLSADATGASLTDASILLNGTRTGLSNLKLWSSTDAAFGSDTQLGSTVTSDPGDGSSATFSSFSSAIGTSDIYYFLTGDVASNATGVVQGVIVNNSSLTLASGTLDGSIINAPLSNGDASLPVELLSFSATSKGNSVDLQWSTASESDNLGFIIERCTENSGWQQIASYQSNAELTGQGTTSSQTQYSYCDASITAGSSYTYRLYEICTNGAKTEIGTTSAKASAVPTTTQLFAAYPNPFNPSTTLKYNLAKDSNVTLVVYDVLGRQINMLSDQYQSAGEYSIQWDGTTDSGAIAPSGIYMVQIQADGYNQFQKIFFIK